MAANAFNQFGQGYDEGQGLAQGFATQRAGHALAGGDYQGAANVLFKSGQLPQGQAAQSLGQAQQDRTTAQHKQEMADRIGFFKQAAGALAQVPDDGTQSARKAAMQHLVPTLQAMGLKPEDITALQQADLSDASLRAFGANLDKEAFTLSQGQTRFDSHGHPIASVAPEQKYEKLGEGDIAVPIPGTGATPAGSAPAAAPGTDSSSPRAVRNNNPLNLTPLPQGQWAGQTGTDGRFATFATPDAGFAAADKNLQAYATHHGIDTLSGIINRWAPQGDGANDPKAYAATVAKDIGVDPNQKLNLADPQVRKAVLQSMAKVESGGSSASTTRVAAASASGDPPGTLYGKPKADGEDTVLSKDAVELLAGRYLKDGTLPPMGMGKTAAANRTAILNRATALAKGLGIDAGDLVAGNVSTKAAASALSKLTNIRAQVTASEHTVVMNADYAMTLAPKGAGPTGAPVLNRWIQAGRKRVAGDPDVAAFDQALGTVADEYAKVMTSNTGSGGVTSDSARAEAYKRLSSSATIPQLKSTIAAMKVEMNNRVSSMSEMEDGLRNQIRGGSGSQQTASAPVQVKSPQEAMALAPGTVFITPDGRRKVR